MRTLKRKIQTLAMLLVGCLLCVGPSAHADEAPTAASIAPVAPIATVMASVATQGDSAIFAGGNWNR